ncbi:MAG: hypothetical protein MZV49_09000 [Rhodopseudomonas palustris]|nr:hypothetical protein [Rhodopseudomonas palustris]
MTAPLRRSRSPARDPGAPPQRGGRREEEERMAIAAHAHARTSPAARAWCRDGARAPVGRSSAARRCRRLPHATAPVYTAREPRGHAARRRPPVAQSPPRRDEPCPKSPSPAWSRRSARTR